MANIDVNWAPGNERYCRPDDMIECHNICPHLSAQRRNLLLNVKRLDAFHLLRGNEWLKRKVTKDT